MIRRQMPRKARITGTIGQDGSCLTELLLEKGHELRRLELPVSLEG